MIFAEYARQIIKMFSLTEQQALEHVEKAWK
jgi:hypothetical protein